ncbi:hypothetical protein [uncultured Flavobacterium sp.]|uniref:hypothetical protein n=1 Tax=uncultured Flavobacterium sp. TaxID=165435 RepID=UPI0030CA4E60
MKKYILTIALFVISYLGFSQTTPTAQMRIADRVTAFGQNVPAGTQIYVVSDRTLWQAKIGIGSALTIDSALAALPGTDYLVKMNSNVSYFVQSFEALDPPGTYTLTYTPLTDTIGITVMMNGAALRPTLDYTSSGVTVTILSAQSQYDKFVVSYTYTDN